MGVATIRRSQKGASMCEICGGTFEHFPGCPYEPEPKEIYECCVCGEPICDGDKYIDGIKGCVCEECVQDLSIDEFMEITGEEFEVAREREE